MSIVQEVGYEPAVVTKEARVWSWALLAFLLLGVYGGGLMGSAAVMNWCLRIAFVIVLVGYVVIAVRHRTATGGPTVAGLPRGTWSVILLMFLMNVVSALYAVLDTPLWGVHSVKGYWDQFVPTVPAFVLPYLGLYVVLYATQGFLGFRLVNRQLRTFLLALALSMSTALATFVLFQTYVAAGPDDQAAYDSGPLGQLLEFVNNDWYGQAWWSDFPSMHCGYATVFAIAWYRRRKPLWSTLMIVLCVAIVIATQVLHEHVLMDALYGIVTATAAYAVSWFWLEYLPAVRRDRATPAGVAAVDPAEPVAA